MNAYLIEGESDDVSVEIDELIDTECFGREAAPLHGMLSTSGIAVRLKDDLVDRVDLTHDFRSSHEPYEEQAEVA